MKSNSTGKKKLETWNNTIRKKYEFLKKPGTTPPLMLEKKYEFLKSIIPCHDIINCRKVESALAKFHIFHVIQRNK